MSHVAHREAAPASVRCAVLTISDTRTDATDAGGQTIVDLLADAGHEVASKAIVRDEPDQIRDALRARLAEASVQVILTTGGTGISRRDGTYEVVAGLLEKRIDGFGELFRALSYDEIGAAAMLSRACAGTAQGKVIICLPGSPHAVRLALTALVLPELRHLVREVSR